eukprot:TRINITY_DN67128_c0_g1_i1.p1 TRINITY_DN67128_c0_g1~~TRINITY_DN67128_c0_g1_i1.p1  ORF type:complete len:234 (+),score=37.90 TRINITY_DN67128_c0_g1_i1:77-778(+)
MIPLQRVTPAQARIGWLKRKPLHATIDGRFDAAHMLSDIQVLSQGAAKEEAAKRFERENNMNPNNFELRPPAGRLWSNPCSFTDVTTEGLTNKVQGGDPGSKRASVYNGQQQLHHLIKSKRRTVNIEQLDPNSNTYKQFKDKDFVALRDDKKMVRKYKLPDGGVILVDFSSVTEADADFTVSGAWDPRTGECTLYHYVAQGLPPEDRMLDEYMDWTIGEGGQLNTPRRASGYH